MNNVVERDEWEIRDDARALARAEEIKADKKRYNEAISMAKVIIKEDANRNNAMKMVAGKKPMTEKDGLQYTFGETLKNIGAKNGII